MEYYSNQKIQALRSRYLELLKEWLETANHLRPPLKDGKCTALEMSDLKSSMHKLAEMGVVCEFLDISKAVKLFETSLSGYNKYHTTIAIELLDALILACEQARSVCEADTQALVEKNTSTSHKKPVLLTVDDDIAIHDIFTTFLSDRAEILTAVNSREALELMNLHQPDLVLLDDNMPGGMTGLELLESIQKMPNISHIPVVMLTANNKQLEIMRGSMFGAVEYITKPFDVQQVIEKIQHRLALLETTVLVVQKDAIIRDFLVAKFRRAGFRVWATGEYRQAMRYAQAGFVALAILDDAMPELDAPELLGQFKKNAFIRSISTAVIVTTQGQESNQKWRDFGVNTCLEKPVDTEHLVKHGLQLLMPAS